MKESTKTPNENPAKADFQGRFLSENGNNKTTGQHGVIPFILSQSGAVIMQNCKQIKIKKINIFLLFLSIFFQDLNPINCLR